jgi:histidine triad (HIT) family protein
MRDCLFCKIVKKEVPATIVYEDKFVIAIIDIFPIHPGHVLILPKEHYLKILSLQN